MPRPLRVLNLASTLSRYAEGLRLQEAVLQDRKQELVGDTLILLQHYPVFTLGKRGRTSDFKVPQEGGGQAVLLVV
ncbi:Octanoyltransferase [Tetrabaena socialis]|uniref:Octanoyltransferase n=1 Tax=Tetrabaena socialis TaxID=47790 RepID=A0A2J8A8Z8_9CHLO|nr:Octanoyltransferase [Tetrabaena socialis]|eukprot:PNH09006.1 Octanoyltransferase [Tetrabaena socialis]